MPTAPTSLPPRLNASRSFLKALNALSPSSLFRLRHENGPRTASATVPPPPDAKPAMPERVANALVQLIHFLEEHHRREEGLYRRRPPTDRESREILKVVRGDGTGSLPDLASFSPYAITASIKEVLAADYEPLIPYSLSQLLLERTAGHSDEATLDEIICIVAKLASSTRELLKVLLIHLHHISSSIASHMDATDLAKHIGVLLIRPSEESDTVIKKDLIKQRRRLARLMIENANSLPYTVDKETTQPVRVDLGSDLQASADNPLPTENSIQQQLHYAQIMWDASKISIDEESLRELLSRFGDVASLAINGSGTRAIAAFTTIGSAQLASEAEIPHVRIRRRKQRHQGTPSAATRSQHSESEFITPAPSPLKETESEPLPTATYQQLPAAALLVELKNSGDGPLQNQVTRFTQDAPIETITSRDEAIVESPVFLHRLERPPSMLLEQRAMKTMQSSDHMTLEDVESPPSSPRAANQDANEAAQPKLLSRISESADDDEKNNDLTSNEADQKVKNQPRELQRRRSLLQLLSVNTTMTNRSSVTVQSEENGPDKTKPQKKLFSPPVRTKIGLISDLKLMIARKRTPHNGSRPAEVVDLITPTFDPPLVKATALETRSVRTQTWLTMHPYQDEATDTDDLQDKDNDNLDGDNPNEVLLIERLTICLNQVKSELINLAAALQAARATDVDRAILQAHERLIHHISIALETEPGNATMDQQGDNSTGIGGSATSEFVSFLETRSTTQVKILEAEVRAGQELLRLHRGQHRKEVDELEAEATSLRVMQSETEKMCAGLRSELRKCRAELTCHVATAASIQRDRRDVDEKLIICENTLRAKEQELLQLQLSHKEMQETAADAQRRLEEYRGNFSRTPANNKGNNLVPNRTELPFPQTAAFLEQHRTTKQNETAGTLRPSTTLTTVLRPGHYVNTNELTSLRRRLEESIHQQMETTKNSLRELQAFGTSELTESDDDLDLEQLQQHLATAEADMQSTMDASRQKLQRLLDPHAHEIGDPFRLERETTSAFDPTGLVQSLLANALASESNQEIAPSPVDGVGNKTLFQPIEIAMPSWRHRPDDTQSEMFRKWMRDRAREPTTHTGTPRSTRSRPTDATARAASGAVHHAQASMRRFQETLAAMNKQ